MMEERAKRKKFHMILAVCMMVLILAADILFLVIPDRAESETENRKLQMFPKLTWNTLTQGRFEKHFDEYAADQFPFRDTWITVQAGISRLAGNTLSNNVFLGRDGYLIQKFEERSEEAYESLLSGFRETVSGQDGIKAYALIAPCAVSILKDLLPANAYSKVSGDEDAFLDRLYQDLEGMRVIPVDVRDEIRSLRDSGTQVYYRTDHHWTTQSAYAAYQAFAKEAGLNSGDVSYDKMLLTDSFQGTLSASSGFRTDLTDDIYIYLPQQGFETEYVVINRDTGERSASLYDTSFLNTRDKYAVFMGGNHGEVKIQTAAQTGRRLMVIKDSYANCFIPFLIHDFDTILVIDPRYYMGDQQQLIVSEEITDILFLYNAGTV